MKVKQFLKELNSSGGYEHPVKIVLKDGRSLIGYQPNVHLHDFSHVEVRFRLPGKVDEFHAVIDSRDIVSIE